MLKNVLLGLGFENEQINTNIEDNNESEKDFGIESMQVFAETVDLLISGDAMNSYEATYHGIADVSGNEEATAKMFFGNEAVVDVAKRQGYKIKGIFMAIWRAIKGFFTKILGMSTMSDKLFTNLLNKVKNYEKRMEKEASKITMNSDKDYTSRIESASDVVESIFRSKKVGDSNVDVTEDTIKKYKAIVDGFNGEISETNITKLFGVTIKGDRTGTDIDEVLEKLKKENEDLKVDEVKSKLDEMVKDIDSKDIKVSEYKTKINLGLDAIKTAATTRKESKSFKEISKVIKDMNKAEAKVLKALDNGAKNPNNLIDQTKGQEIVALHVAKLAKIPTLLSYRTKAFNSVAQIIFTETEKFLAIR